MPRFIVTGQDVVDDGILEVSEIIEVDGTREDLENNADFKELMEGFLSSKFGEFARIVLERHDA